MVLNSVCLFVCLFIATSLAENLTISISDGQVKGTKEGTFVGNSYYAFYSIMYAKNPTGPLRFQAPVAVDPWEGVYDATFEKSICYQTILDSPLESEDCLSINVYTPNDPSKILTKLPVLVYIYGGAFYMGSSQTKGYVIGGVDPGFFMDTAGVVMVSFNYRLGPFGFFSTGDSVIPGNAGLKDQVLALQWVQKNIAYFGGDAGKVTIWGESAGGASVGYLLLSPSAQGLFHGGILSSGTSIAQAVIQLNQTEITYETASIINPEFNTERDSQKLLAFLQSIDAKAIDTASYNYSLKNLTIDDMAMVLASQMQGVYYGPVVEAENSNPFLVKRPYEAFASGDFNQVPILTGGCADEGLMFNNDNLTTILSKFDQAHYLLVPQGMHIADQETKDLVGELIKQEYSPDSDFQDNLLAGINYYTEESFLTPQIRHGELQSNYTDVYFYIFSYSGQMGGGSRFPGTSNVTHCEEGNYLWQVKNPADYPVADQIVHQKLMKLWMNFITYQNPTPAQDQFLENVTWPKLKEGNLQYVNIGADLSVQINPKERYAFWKNLFEEYGVRPFETY